MNGKQSLWCAVMLCITSLSFAQVNQEIVKLEDPDWVKEIAAPPIVYTVPRMELVKARKDITYKRVGDEELKMDIYRPPGLSRAARRPAILFIHGGRVPANLLTKPKQWGVFVSYGQLAAASGFIGVTFNHRFYQFESLADSQSDVNDAIRYVREHAEALGVDPDRICLWAFSAGGIFLSEALRTEPSYLRCLVSYYAVLDMQERGNMPQSVSDATLREFSPVASLKPSGQRLPLFVARAGRDDPDLNRGADRFVAEAISRNATINFVNHAEGQHGFDVLDDNDRTREIIRMTMEFMKARL